CRPPRESQPGDQCHRQAQVSDPDPDRRSRLDRAPAPGPCGRMEGQGPGRGSRVPLRSLRHLRRRVARAVDRRRAALPSPPSSGLKRAGGERRQGRRRVLLSPATLGYMIGDVTEQDFNAKVLDRSAQVPVLVDFWAEWCGPCRTLGPALEKAVQARGGEVELAKLDTDRNPQLALEYEIASIPAVKAFKDGKVVSEFI